MEKLIIQSPAKLNLYLKVTKKLSNGYHELDTSFQLIDIFDTLEFVNSDSTNINVSCSERNINQEDNIIFKAANKLKEITSKKVGINISLKKNIPIGAGLGGGSSDAATILMGINKLANINLTKKELMTLGLGLGADVPFFIFGENAWVEGVGEKLSKFNIPNFIYYLCYPNFSISTESIFKSFKLTKVPITLKMSTCFSEKIDQECNDLEFTITKKYIKMKKLLSWMNNFGFAKISGTGSSVFVKIADVKEAQFVDEKKPIDFKSFIVKGLSKHPFYDVLS